MTACDFDVLVAGAGVGGSIAAYFLTRAGLRVLVVEKESLPRYKACGGAIPRSTLNRLPFACDDLVRAVPAEIRFTSPGLSPSDVTLPDRPVVMVMRREFDAYLLDRSGAEVLDRQTVSGLAETKDAVRVTVGRRMLTARFLVGADGAASTVAQRLGLRRHRRLVGTLEAQVPLNGNHLLCAKYGERALFSLTPIPWGYAWVFPKGDCLSVGIVRLRPGRVDLRPALRNEMHRLDISLEGVRLRGHPLPCYQAPRWPWWRGRQQEQLSTRRCVLVGDAAGLVDPFLGEGIRYAICSARMAAEAIVKDDLSAYEAAVWRGIGHSLATAGMVADLFYRWPRQCFHLSLRNPATIRHLVDLMSSPSSYEGIGRRLFASTARWPLGGNGRQAKVEDGMFPLA